MPRDLEISDSATSAEAAAIAAAVGVYLDAERTGADAGETAGDDAWDGDRWRFRGRIEALQSRSVRVPDGAPTEPWRAAGRAEQF